MEIKKIKQLLRTVDDDSNLNEVINVSEKLIEDTKNTYNKISYKYDDLHSGISILEKKLWNKLYKYSIERFKSTKIKALEVGCGNGKDINYGSDNFDFDCYGIDNSEKFIEISKKNNPNISTDNILLADMRELPFENDAFHIVRQNATILHLPLVSKGVMADKAISESYRVLVNGGILFVMVKKGSGVKSVDTNEGLGARFFQFYEAGDLKNLLERNNFSIIEMDVMVGDLDTEWLYAFAIK